MHICICVVYIYIYAHYIFICLFIYDVPVHSIHTVRIPVARVPWLGSPRTSLGPAEEVLPSEKWHLRSGRTPKLSDSRDFASGAPLRSEVFRLLLAFRHVHLDLVNMDLPKHGLRYAVTNNRRNSRHVMYNMFVLCMYMFYVVCCKCVRIYTCMKPHAG